VKNAVIGGAPSTSSVGTGLSVAFSRNIQLPIECVSESESDRNIVTRTWWEIGVAGMDKIEPEVQRVDDDGLEEPLPRSGVPGFCHQGTLFERRDIAFQVVDDSMNHLQGNLLQAVAGELSTGAHCGGA